MTFLTRRVKRITGCDAYGPGMRESVYLTRVTLLCLGPLGSLYLHIIHRSDAGDYHDHPWGFVSLILWGGYYEQTPDGLLWLKRPGYVLFRRATWTHRVRLRHDMKRHRDVPAVTLVYVTRPIREWGFYTPGGWQTFRDYFRERGC